MLKLPHGCITRTEIRMERGRLIDVGNERARKCAGLGKNGPGARLNLISHVQATRAII